MLYSKPLTSRKAYLKAEKVNMSSSIKYDELIKSKT